jgi:N-acetylmuramoyl-L-alanine amidase
VRVLKPGFILICLAAIMAGCSTRQYRESSETAESAARQKNAPLEIEHVQEAPLVAPPPQEVLVRTNPPARDNLAENWISLSRWSLENHVGSVEHIAAAPLQTFALNASNGVFVAQAKSLVAKWNGLELRLGFEPQFIGDQLFIHTLDVEKNIEPLIEGAPPMLGDDRVIVIDPGHGGSNRGTTNVIDGVAEKELTLDWARRLEPLLATNGWKVFLTRTNDAELSLSNRVAFADDCDADLFISLHFNSAAPNQEQAGLETFCLTPQGMASTLTRGYEDDASLTFTNNLYDEENLQYAVLLHRALMDKAGLADRGIRRARFLGVLRGQNRPAVLIEGGYLSNPREARRISDPAFRQKLAEALADALRENVNIGMQNSETGTATNNVSGP